MVSVTPRLLPIKSHSDSRGFLGVLEHLDLPFSIERVFWINQVPSGTVRGGHAHIESQQLLICTQGVIKASLEDLRGQVYEYVLKDNKEALYIPPKVWGSFLFEGECQALALASNLFSEEDYIRDYHSFKALTLG